MFVPLGGGQTTQTAPVTTISPPTTVPSSPIRLPTNDLDKCGISNATHSRVVGGNNAQLGAYPWLGAIGYRVTGGIKYLCGGTLITQKHVLTAGHCVKDTLVHVRLGEHDLTSDYDGANPIDYAVDLRILHEGFDAKTILNDIGLLRLAQTVVITNRIRPACLPLTNDMKTRDFTYYQPFVAGALLKTFFELSMH